MAPPEGAPVSRSGRSLLQHALSRQGLLATAGVLSLCLIAWSWLWQGGMDMSGAGMNSSGMNSAGEAMKEMPGMPPAALDLHYLVAAFVMWSIMMVAMMLPSAAPMILLQDRFCHARGLGAAATLGFAAGYLALWTGFSLMAALAQVWLVSEGIVGRATLAVGGRHLEAGLLLAAGLYEMSPLKRTCLAHCQSPVAFLTHHWRPGVSGALRMGLAHGRFCLGCCWMLMLLLFVGGVMDLGWVALLALVVLAEKLAPPAWRADRALAALLILAAGAILLEPMVA